MSEGMVPPPQIWPPSAPVAVLVMLGTMVFQATQPPSRSAALAVFSLASLAWVTRQPPASGAIGPPSLESVRSASPSVFWL